MNAFQILFALEGYDEEKIQSCIEILSTLGIQINNVYMAQSKDEMANLVIAYPDINVIVVSEQLKGFITINDFRLFNTDNRIIIPVISRYKKGNAEAIGKYFKSNFYNLLFESDTLMKEVGEILLYGRAEEEAVAYVGLAKGVMENRSKQAELINSSANSNAVGMQFMAPASDRTKQTIFSDKSVLLGFCGTDSGFYCTLSAISAANYIAAGGLNVAFIEPDFSKGTLLDQLIPGLSGKVTINCANVDYYSGWNLNEDINSADVIVIDFSGMLYEESIYLSKMNKIFISSDIELTNIDQSIKLQNNSSFRYSIFYKDNSLAQDSLFDDNTFEVFRECPKELIRMLKLTLIGYGIDITGNSDAGNGNRINQLNGLNQAEYSARNINNSLVERRRKYSDGDTQKDITPKDITQKDITFNNRRPQPLMTLTKPTVQAPIPVTGSNNITRENKQKTTEASQELQQLNNGQKNLRTFTVGNMLNRSTETVSPSNEPQLEKVRQTLTNTDNKMLFNPKMQKEEDSDFRKDRENEYNNEYDESYEVENDGYEDTYEVKEVNRQNNIDENRNKFKKKQSANQVLCGKETIFITGLKHGCGCSHTGLSFARYIIGTYSENICICHRKGAYDLEDEDIAEYTKDTDYGSIFGTNRFIIYDCGILGELNADQLVELKRCNIKIMVCNGDEKYLGNLSNFIRKLGNTSNEWIFAFNLVTSREKEIMIRRIMDGYKICFIPLHDCENIPKKTAKIWDSVLKRNLL